MRDVHKLAGKVDLSLDSRQLVSITVALLVVLGGVFTLGIVVGKQISASLKPVREPADLLSQVDKKSKTLKQVQQQPSALTFQDELTKKPSTPEVETPPKKPRAARPAVPSAGKKTSAATGAAIPTRIREGDALKNAFGEKPADKPGANVWTVQLAAYRVRTEADGLATQLRAKGYVPYIVKATVEGKGTWHRVRMGRFPTREAAVRYAADFRRETKMTPIVIRAR